MLIKYFRLAGWIGLFQLVGFGTGWLMQQDLSLWYRTIKKSSLTPPDYVFGPVWGILYAILAIVGWYIWEYNKTSLKNLFSMHMFLNWLWSPIFFNMHSFGLALACIIIMLITLVQILSRTARLGLNNIVYALIPYLGWLMFATYLNAVVAFSN